MEQQLGRAGPETDERLLAARQIRVRGSRQLVAVQALMEQLTVGRTDLEAGVKAAQEVASFAFSEGWVTGPLWVAYGSRFLLARWALERDISSEEVAEFFSRQRESAEAVADGDNAV